MTTVFPIIDSPDNFSLKWCSIKNQIGVDCGAVLCSLVLYKKNNPPAIEPFDEGKSHMPIPTFVRPTMKPALLNILFWGVRGINIKSSTFFISVMIGEYEIVSESIGVPIQKRIKQEWVNFPEKN